MFFQNLSFKGPFEKNLNLLKNRLIDRKEKVTGCEKDYDLMIKAHETLEEDMEFEIRRLTKHNHSLKQRVEQLKKANLAFKDEMIARVLQISSEESFQVLFVFLLEDRWPCEQEWLIVYLDHGQLGRVEITTWSNTENELYEVLSKVHSKTGIMAFDKRSNLIRFN